VGIINILEKRAASDFMVEYEKSGEIVVSTWGGEGK
jgi:hypothetical protein